MTDEAGRWDRVKQVFQDALDRTPDERSAFLREACGADRDLRTEVESLLLAHEEAGTFAERPAIHGLLDRHGISLAPARDLQAGDRLGPYEIVARLGAGGMGEVTDQPQSPAKIGHVTLVVNWFEDLKRRGLSNR